MNLTDASMDERMIDRIRSRASREEASIAGRSGADAERTLGALADIGWLLHRVDQLREEVGQLRRAAQTTAGAELAADLFWRSRPTTQKPVAPPSSWGAKEFVTNFWAITEEDIQTGQMVVWTSTYVSEMVPVILFAADQPVGTVRAWRHGEQPGGFAATGARRGDRVAIHTEGVGRAKRSMGDKVLECTYEYMFAANEIEVMTHTQPSDEAWRLVREHCGLCNGTCSDTGAHVWPIEAALLRRRLHRFEDAIDAESTR